MILAFKPCAVCAVKVSRQMSKKEELMLLTIIMITAVKPCAFWKSLGRCLREEELMLMTIMMIAAVKPCALTQSLDRCP